MAKKTQITLGQRVDLLANRRFSIKDPVFIGIAVCLILVGVVMVIHAEAYQVAGIY